MLDQKSKSLEIVRATVVDEIRYLTTKDSSRHCPGHLNPADLPSRGLTAKALVACETVERPELSVPS